MNTQELIQKSTQLEWLSVEEGMYMYQNFPLPLLMQIAHSIRFSLHPEPKVSWIIDRNVNITNACVSSCSFCNFHRPIQHQEVFITSMEDYESKITELFELGGNQLLLQGGMHPHMPLQAYEHLFSELKKKFPNLKLHALGPPEIAYLAKQSGKSYQEVLIALMKSGLDSLPGAGAEILHDDVRNKISPAKCSATEWYEVMREAHRLYLPTTATMMFGHVENREHRIGQMVDLRKVQYEKPQDAVGFISFIPWTFQGENTRLSRKYQIKPVSDEEYLRTIAMSRIMMPNIPNIQPSWLTVGKKVAQLCLWAGANDLGSVMIEEHVVSSAGASYSISIDSMQEAIREAGFVPVKRNQLFQEV